MKKETELRAAIQRALDGCREAGAPGAILSIDLPARGFTFSGASGLFSLGEPRPLKPEDPFRAASVTKSVTAAAAVRLAAGGCWSLDDPVVEYLSPRIAVRLLSVAGRHGTGALTLRRLLGHTSGLPDYFFDERFQAKVKSDPGRTWRGEDLAEAALEIGRLDFSPGSGFSYGDTGFVLVGLAMERLLGDGLAGAYRTLIFDPLGMDSTYLEWHEPARGLPVSHHYDGGQDLLPVNTSFDWAGGGLVTTAGDLVKFLRGLFGGGLFPESWLAEMTAWREDLRWRPGSSARYLRYGLGIGVNQASHEEILGATGVWGAFAYFWQAAGAAIAGTVNQRGLDRSKLLDEVVRAMKDLGR